MSIRQDTDAEPVPLCRAVADLLERSDERDQWQLRLEAEYKTGYDIGYAVGVAVGRRQVLDEEAAWRRGTAALTRDALAGRPFDDLEFLRWGPAAVRHSASLAQVTSRAAGRQCDPRPRRRVPRRA